MGYSPWGHKESDTTEAIEHVYIGRLEVPGTAPSPPTHLLRFNSLACVVLRTQRNISLTSLPVCYKRM